MRKKIFNKNYLLQENGLIVKKQKEVLNLLLKMLKILKKQKMKKSNEIKKLSFFFTQMFISNGIIMKHKMNTQQKLILR